MVVTNFSHSCCPLFVQYSFVVCKLGWVKLRQIAPDSPKFSPATILRYTVLMQTYLCHGDLDSTSWT